MLGAHGISIQANSAWRASGGRRPPKRSEALLTQREIDVYRAILPHAPAGKPSTYGAVADASAGRYWQLLEQVRGLPLWQVGDVAMWEQAAAWIARFAGRERCAIPFHFLRNPPFFRPRDETKIGGAPGEMDRLDQVDATRFSRPSAREMSATTA